MCMRKSVLSRILAAVAVLLLASSCGVIVHPNPLIGSYKILVAEEGFSYAFTLREDGTYSMIQYVEDRGYVTSGTYAIDLASFDFEMATGEIRFRVDRQTPGLSGGYCFAEGVDNVYLFEWSADASTPSRILRLSPAAGENGFPEDAVSMDDEVFAAQLEKWEGESI